MHKISVLLIVGLLVPSLTLGQGTKMQVESTQTTTTGIEHEDIGIVGTSNSSGSAKGSVETEFKVEQGERVMTPEYGADGDPDKPIISGTVPATDKSTPKLMEATNKGTREGEKDDTSSNFMRTSKVGGDGEDIGAPEASGKYPDSFFDIFVDLHNDDTRATVDAFLKLGDIKGESMDNAEDDEDGAGDVRFGDGESGARPVARASKPKEIVVVGSKVRAAVQTSAVAVRGWDSVKKEITIDPDDIAEGKDFLDFLGAVVLSDENIENVTFNFQKIKMKYDQQAKLFGFININLSATTEVDELGKVKIKLPWYRFLTKNNGKELRSEVEIAVSEAHELGHALEQHEETDIDFLRDRARIFQAVSNVMKAHHDTAKAVIQNIRA